MARTVNTQTKTITVETEVVVHNWTNQEVIDYISNLVREEEGLEDDAEVKVEQTAGGVRATVVVPNE